MPLKNPYEGCKDTNGKRITIDVSLVDYNLVKCTRPTSGTLSGVFGTLFFKLCEELRLREINNVTKQNEFEHFVSTCRLIPSDELERLQHQHATSLSDSSTGAVRHQPNERESSTRTQRKRTSGVRDASAHSAKQPSGVQGESGGGEGGNGATASGTEKS